MNHTKLDSIQLALFLLNGIELKSKYSLYKVRSQQGYILGFVKKGKYMKLLLSDKRR